MQSLSYRIQLVLLLFLLAASCTEVPTDKSEREQPNIIFILADDLGWADVGYNSGGQFQTPNIDRMQKEGFYFSEAYANAPVCSPSRACLLTGLYPPRHGIYNVNKSHAGPEYSWPLITAPQNEDLDTAFITIAEVLKEDGYQTGFIGKWHLWEEHPEYSPQNQGFDYVFGGDPDGKVKSHFPRYGPASLPNTQDEKYLADLLTDSAVHFIDRYSSNDGGPFFLFLSHYAVHDPIQAKPEDIALFKNTFTDKDSIYFNPTYAAMVKNLDDNVGRILQTVENKGLLEETIIVFFSDNGGSLAYTSNTPLRSGKGTLYEGGIRVPLIFYGGKDWVTHASSNIPIHSLDLFPTLVKMATGNELPQLDGNDLSATIQKTENTFLNERSIFWVYPAQKRFQVRHKTEALFDRTAFPVAVIRKGSFKFIHYFDLFPDELYDLAKDVSEKNNLVEQEAQLYQVLKQELENWLERTKAYIPIENPAFDGAKSIENGLWKSVSQ